MKLIDYLKKHNFKDYNQDAGPIKELDKIRIKTGMVMFPSMLSFVIALGTFFTSGIMGEYTIMGLAFGAIVAVGATDFFLMNLLTQQESKIKKARHMDAMEMMEPIAMELYHDNQKLRSAMKEMMETAGDLFYGPGAFTTLFLRLEQGDYEKFKNELYRSLGFYWAKRAEFDKVDYQKGIEEFIAGKDIKHIEQDKVEHRADKKDNLEDILKEKSMDSPSIIVNAVASQYLYHK